VLINEGTSAIAVIVLSGRVKVFASNEAGREFVIDFHGPGEYVGEMSLDGARRSASVITVDRQPAPWSTARISASSSWRIPISRCI